MDRRQVLQVAATLGFSACSKAGLTVGSKNFVEQDILGEIVTQLLTKHLGHKPRQKLHLGGSYLAHQALIQGDIDLYPEYSGTALVSCLKLPIAKDSKAVFDAVKSAYATRHAVEWGWPLGFPNTFAMVVRSGTDVKSISAALAAQSEWLIGVGYEFEQRADGWPSFRQTYPLKATLKTMDLGLLYRALAAKDVDMVAGNSTDPALATGEFTMLQDDRNFFPPYETCLAVRQDALAKESKLRSTLDILTGKIDVDRMRKWNAQAVIEHQKPERIAAAFVSTL